MGNAAQCADLTFHAYAEAMTSVLRCLLLVLLSGSALAATPLPTPAHGGTVRYGYTDVTLDLRAPTAAATSTFMTVMV